MGKHRRTPPEAPEVPFVLRAMDGFNRSERRRHEREARAASNSVARLKQMDRRLPGRIARDMRRSVSGTNRRAAAEL